MYAGRVLKYPYTGFVYTARATTCRALFTGIFVVLQPIWYSSSVGLPAPYYYWYIRGYAVVKARITREEIQGPGFVANRILHVEGLEVHLKKFCQFTLRIHFSLYVVTPPVYGNYI
jgi:hypothetical protein